MSDSLLIAFGLETLFVLLVLAGIVAYVLHDSRDIQARLTMNSRALNRYIKHLLGPEHRAAEETRVREDLREELLRGWEQERAELEAAQAQALANLQAELESLRSAAEVQDAEDTEAQAQLQAAEAALADDLERQSAFREEMEKLRNLVKHQEEEIAKLRSRLDVNRLDETTTQLLAVEKRQREQQQRMMREMEMCIQVMEGELAETRKMLQLAIKRLRRHGLH